ncbi:MAG: type II toxin-antitoxin system VapC family toxin [Thermoprotei archaeon]|nr:type II toxin-antitoxin system VapC family toxin [Thermoprotei archaeon]
MKVFVDASLLVYLNVKMPDDEAKLVEDFWLDLLSNHLLYINALVLDEVIYVSKRKYDVEFKETIDFIDRAILPYVDVLPIGLNEYLRAKELMVKYGLRPSDSIHVATIENHGLQAIATEDEDFDKVGLKKLWIKT